MCIQCYHHYVLQSLMFFASFLIEVNEFLKTLSKRQSLRVAKQRLTGHQDLGIYHNSQALSTCMLKNISYSILAIDEDQCQVCKQKFQEGEDNLWVGCDLCTRWYHWKCLGYKRRPSKKQRLPCICSKTP